MHNVCCIRYMRLDMRTSSIRSESVRRLVTGLSFLQPISSGGRLTLKLAPVFTVDEMLPSLSMARVSSASGGVVLRSKTRGDPCRPQRHYSIVLGACTFGSIFLGGKFSSASL